MPQILPGTIAMTIKLHEFDEPIRNQLAMTPTMQQPKWPKNPEQIYSKETIGHCAGGGREEAVLIPYVKILQIIFMFNPDSN